MMKSNPPQQMDGFSSLRLESCDFFDNDGIDCDQNWFSLRPGFLESDLPKAGRKIARQEFRNDEVPIVCSEILGENKSTLFIPKKNDKSKAIAKKDLVKIYRSIDASEGLIEVHHVFLKNKKIKADGEKAYIKADAFGRRCIKDSAENQIPKEKMSHSFTNSVWYLASDIPGAVGCVQSVANFHFCNDPGITGFRTASAGGILTGAVNYLRAADEMEVADRINDVAGKQFALFRYIRSAFEITGGVFAAAYRALSLIPQAAKVVVTALPILGNIWNCLGIGKSLFIFIPMILNARKASKWMVELDLKMQGCNTEKSKAAAGLEFLIDKLELSQKEKEDACKDVFTKNLLEIIDEDVVLNKDEEKILHRKDREEIAERINEEMNLIKEMGLPENFDMENIRLNLSVRLMKGWAERKMVREAEYRRVFGQSSLGLLKKEIREETDLSRELYYSSKALNEVTTVLKKIKEDVNWNWKFTLFTTTTCIIGILGTIAGMVFSAGTAPFIVGVSASVLSNIMGTLIDMYCFKEDAEGLNDSGYKDRVMIILFSLLTVISAVLGGVFYQDVVTLAIVTVGSLCMLGLNAYAYKLSLDKEKEAKLIKERIEEKQLSDQREAIREQERLITNRCLIF